MGSAVRYDAAEIGTSIGLSQAGTNLTVFSRQQRYLWPRAADSYGTKHHLDAATDVDL